MIIRAIFPWCFTPELYAAEAGLHRVAGGIRSEPAAAISAGFPPAVECRPRARCGSTSGTNFRADADHLRDSRSLTSTRFADRLKRGIRRSELLIFDGCAHAALYENVEEFNQRTLAFLQRHAGAAVGA